jgi:hypothetical protein
MKLPTTSTCWGLLTQSAIAFFVALGACRAGGNGVVGRTAGPASVGEAGIAPTASTAAHDADPSLQQSKIPDGVERVYRGTIGADLAIVMRLRRQGALLSGRYFYEKKGVDLDLSGSLTDDGHVALEERLAPVTTSKKTGKPTGTFEGVFDKSGALTGTWTDEARQHPLPFRLEPSTPSWAPGSPVTLYKKIVHLVRKPERPGISPIYKECSFDAAFPEVDGVFEPEVEAKINAKLHIKLAIPAPRCDIADSNELSYAVALNRAGVLSVVFDFNWCCGAHPSYSREFVNLTIPHGEEISLAGLLAPHAKPKLASFLRPLIAKLGDDDAPVETDNELLEQLTQTPADFSIEEKGLRLSAFNSQPYVIQSLFAEGFLLPYSKLSGLLKVPGPLDPLARQAP